MRGTSERSGILGPVFGLVLVCAPAVCAAAIVNPHVGEHCSSCHTKAPVPGPDGKIADYRFLGEDVDATCMVCHSQDCCRFTKPHQTTHPSAIDRWDEKKYGRPSQLPLQNGYITCITCHFWRREVNPSPVDYHLVRMMEITPQKLDWTNLCVDCHKDL